MRGMIFRSWLHLLLLGCVGCSSLNPALRVSVEKARDAVAPTLPPQDWNALSYLQPIQQPRPSIAELGLKVPQASKDHTYLFFINGLDPYFIANFRGQCQYMKTLGYANAYCGQMNHTGLFRQKIVQIRKNDAQARIIVSGYSTGANCARTLANQLKEDGARIELLVYVGGDTIKDVDRSRPDNVGRVLNIIGHASVLIGGDLILRGPDIKGASNHRLDALHFKLPTRAEATELLVQHVAKLHRDPLLPDPDAPATPTPWTTSGDRPINSR